MKPQTLPEAVALIDALKGDALNPRQAEAAGIVVSVLRACQEDYEQLRAHCDTLRRELSDARQRLAAEHAEVERLRAAIDGST